MKQATVILVLITMVIRLASSAKISNLDQKYPYVTNLDDGFKLYWKYDLAQQSIDFACNVSTNGWFGFGISPDGKMLYSDIVVGWVNRDGSAQFHDRFAAVAHILPPIDESQDWYMKNSDQQNGYTVMEVTRQLVTCDKKDVPIKAGVSHIVFAYHSQGPNQVTSLDSLTPEHLGAISVNLIPGTGNEVKNQLKQKSKMEL